MLASQPASSESHPTPFFHSAELLHSNTLSQQRTLLSSGGAPQIWNKRTVFLPILDLPENTPDDRPRRSTRLPIPITDFPTKHHQEKSSAQIFLSFLTLFAHTDQRSAAVEGANTKILRHVIRCSTVQTHTLKLLSVPNCAFVPGGSLLSVRRSREFALN